MPAKVELHRLSGLTPGTSEKINFLRFRSDDQNLRDTSSPCVAPQPVYLSLTQNVSASVSLQTANVSESIFLTPGDFLIVQPDSESQEVVLVDAIPSTTEVTAFFRKSHPVGSLLRKVSGSFSKSLQLSILTSPSNSIARIRLKRVATLPLGVYDQLRFPPVYSQSLESNPWHSTSLNLFSKVPEEWFQFAIGPYSSVGPVDALVEIQWLFTAQIQDVPASAYRFGWDES